MKSSIEMTKFLEKHIRWNVFARAENVNSNSSLEMPIFLPFHKNSIELHTPATQYFLKNFAKAVMIIM